MSLIGHSAIKYFKTFLLGRVFVDRNRLPSYEALLFYKNIKVLADRSFSSSGDRNNNPDGKEKCNDVGVAGTADQSQSDEPAPVHLIIKTDSHLMRKRPESKDGRAGRVIPQESEDETNSNRKTDKYTSPALATLASHKARRPIPPPIEDENILTEDDLIPPTNCCMSGCPSCVWIEYIEKLTELYSNPDIGKERIHHEIESIDDPNIKACLILDLKFKGLW